MTWPFENLTPLRYGAILADPPWRMKMYSERAWVAALTGL